MRAFAASLFAAAVSANASADLHKFLQYLQKFGKNYPTVEEFLMRSKLFAEAEAFIANHDEPGALYTLAHNAMSDMTDAEMAARRGYIPDLTASTPSIPQSGNLNLQQSQPTPVPDSWDWRDHGCVNPIRDQGQCGSCWTFSAAASMATSHCINTGELVEFSTQQLVDCDSYCYGCNGGNFFAAWYYYYNTSAITEDNYPYTSSQGTATGSCLASGKTPAGVNATNMQQVPVKDVSSLKQALTKTAVSVAIDASSRDFNYYRSGIFNYTQCGTNLDHAVQLVGYGSENGTDYWILRNSWNTWWGEEGYMRMIIDPDSSNGGTCGVLLQAGYVTTN